jgi:hypothetical protein
MTDLFAAGLIFPAPAKSWGEKHLEKPFRRFAHSIAERHMRWGQPMLLF